MTLHEKLQMYPKLHEIHLSKDKTYSNSTFAQNLTCKAINFGFLNVNLKAMLYSLKNSTTFILGISSLNL
jgi:hypothetical protein